MSNKFQKQVHIELENLHSLLDIHHQLFEKCTTTVPDIVELSALAAVLHSFYTGIENIFKRCALIGSVL